jgi:ubiquinone/menaquinone biosynthesis C-methylase UbiE
MHEPADTTTTTPLGNIRAAIDQLSGEPHARVPEGLLGLAAPKPGETVVDLGCQELAEGFQAMRQVGAAGRVRGFVESGADREHATALRDRWIFADLAFRLARLDAIPLDDEVADVVLVNTALEQTDEPLRILEEARRLLAPNGRLVVAVTGDEGARLRPLLEVLGLRILTLRHLTPGRSALLAARA